MTARQNGPRTKSSRAKKRSTGKPRPLKSASPRSKPSAKRRSLSTEALPGVWLEFIGSLCSHRVRFLVVGAHALAVAGVPRFTRDLDILVEPTRANAERVCAALSEFGYGALSREIDAFASTDRMATLGREPLRIDVMTSISGVSFREAWRGRVVTKIAGKNVAFLGKAAFVKNKLASGRTKDLLDVELLREARSKR